MNEHLAESAEFKQFIPFVAQLTAVIIRRLPPNVLYDDVLAAGRMGLLRALTGRKHADNCEKP